MMAVSEIINTFVGSRFAVVPVKPGDLGTKFLVLDDDAGGNRHVSIERVAKYAKHLSDFEKVGHLTLLESGRVGVYYILDGQHRINAISNHGDRIYSLPAIILSPEDIARTGIGVADYIRMHNSGAPHTKHDTYSMYNKSVLWTAMAAEMGLQIGYSARRGTSSGFCWADLISARWASNHMIRNSAPRATRAEVDKIRMDLWQTSSEATVRETLNALKWWDEGHRIALKRKINAMSHKRVLAIALTVYRQNKTNPALKGAPQRLAESPLIEQLRKVSDSTTFQVLSEPVMQGLNYHQIKHLLGFLGYTGRN